VTVLIVEPPTIFSLPPILIIFGIGIDVEVDVEVLIIVFIPPHPVPEHVAE
jgi:hypothetical protein